VKCIAKAKHHREWRAAQPFDRMRSAATFCLSVLAAMASGCANNWKSRSLTQATIYAETTEIPVLFADSTFVAAVDGINIERGRGFALVDPGPRSLTIFHVSCPLPIIAVFCLKSASKREISSNVKAGSVYRIGWDSLTEVRSDGRPVDRLQTEKVE
jgi:hypothetical protein